MRILAEIFRGGLCTCQAQEMQKAHRWSVIPGRRSHIRGCGNDRNWLSEVAPTTDDGPSGTTTAIAHWFSLHPLDVMMRETFRFITLLSSSMAEHPAVNRRVVGSSPT